MQSLGDRIKKYEDVYRTSLTPRMPLIIRIDGKAFHSYTRGFKPFDTRLRNAMVMAASKTAEEMQGFEIAYHQSDEVSFLLTDYSEINTGGWFDYNLQKVTTIAASSMTAWFNRYIYSSFSTTDIEVQAKIISGELMAYFDARAFVVPREDVSNYFLWRAKDFEETVCICLLGNFSLLSNFIRRKN